MCERSEAANSNPSMFSAGDSPVRTSATPVSGPESPGQDPGSGLRCADWFARFDPVSSSWKTSQLYLDGVWESYSETWPRAGTMRNGTAYRRPPLAPLTAVIGFSSLPTPVAAEWTSNIGGSRGRVGKVRYSLIGMARYGMWPTPTAADSKSSRNTTANRRKMPPTGRHSGATLTDAMVPHGGKLNPTWVEWLMGFPIGWTDCEPSETPSCPRSPSGSGDG